MISTVSTEKRGVLLRMLSEKALIAVTSAAAGICALKAWELIVVPRIFAARLREIARAAREPCVLDVSKETVANYRRGGIDLIRKARLATKNPFHLEAFKLSIAHSISLLIACRNQPTIPSTLDPRPSILRDPVHPDAPIPSVFLQDLRASCLPTHVVEFFDALLIARGVDQAFRTKIELVNFKKVVLHLQNLFEAAESELSVFSAMLYVPHDSEGSTKEARKRDVQILKDLDECRGMLHVLREVRTWTAAICKVPRYPTQERLFIASDSEIRSIPVEMGAAGGLKGRLDALQRKVAARASEFKKMVDEQGWPPQCAGSQGKGRGGEGDSKGGKGQRECARCGLGFGRKWLVGALCWKCRDELKGSGECWKLVRKKDAEGGGGGTRTCYVCPHSGKCLGCEDASCNACRMVRLSDMDDGLSSYVQVFSTIRSHKSETPPLDPDLNPKLKHRHSTQDPDGKDESSTLHPCRSSNEPRARTRKYKGPWGEGGWEGGLVGKSERGRQVIQVCVNRKIASVSRSGHLSGPSECESSNCLTIPASLPDLASFSGPRDAGWNVVSRLGSDSVKHQKWWPVCC
jgi:hypothetical protein